MTSSSRETLPTSSFIYEIPIDEVNFSKDDRLGCGSFGDVYTGIWRNREVAVKVFRRQIKSFMNELKQLSEIRHPNIVRLYGSSQPSSNEAYLIMELATCPLDNLLHETLHQEYDLRHACNWAHQAAAAMSYCHDLKPKALIHRDIKPANLLLFDGGKVLKICDFGTAVSQRSTMTNNTGTVYYMAPEVYRDVHYDARCDVFSWSIMFWEILARKKPYSEFKDCHILKLQNDISEKGLRPEPLRSCPQLIWKLIEKSWDGKPENRPHMKRVVQEMVLICRMAGIKSSRTSNSSSSNSEDAHGHHKTHHGQPSSSTRTSVTSLTSNQGHQTMNVLNGIATTESDDLLAKRKMFNHIRAMKYRLESAEDRRKLLEQEASGSTMTQSSDQVDELKQLDDIINSFKDRLNH